MHLKVAMTIMALSLGGALILSSSPVSAQQGQQQEQKKLHGKSRGGGGGQKAHTRREGGARKAAPHSSRRSVTRRKTHTATPHSNTRRKVHTATPKYVAPKGALNSGSPDGGKHVATAGKIRGAAHARIRGRNFSVWRNKHRIRHGNGFRTFVGLSTLGAIVYGSGDYYPYAYLSATERYCSGLTNDGCVLRWQEVETIEGDVIEQCVAYCPWQ